MFVGGEKVTAWLHHLRLLAGDLYRKLEKDNLTGNAAMMAFNLVFSILAFLLLVVFIAGQLFHSPDVVNNLLNELDRIFPGADRHDLGDTIDSIRDRAGRIGLIALISMLWTGSSFWSTVNHTLSEIYRVPNRSFLRRRLQGAAFSLILVVFLSLVVVLAGSIGVTSASRDDRPFGLERIPGIVSYVSLAVTFIVAAGLLAFVYGIGPNTRIRWPEIWPGTVAGSVLITLLSLLFPAYATSFDLTRYGAAFGFVVLILTWLYLVCLVILVGAELNSLRHGDYWRTARPAAPQSAAGG